MQEYKVRFHKWADRKFKTDTSYLLSGGFWLLLGRAINILLGLALTIGFANLISQQAYGTYRFVLSIASLIGALSLTGMAVAVTRSAANGFEGALKKGVNTSLMWSVGMAIAGLIGSAYYFINGNEVLALSLLIVGSFSPFLESFKLYNSFLIGKKEFKANTLYSLVRKFVPTGTLLVTLFITSDPIILVLVYFLSNTITIFLIYRDVTSRFVTDIKSDTTMVSYSKHLSLMNVVGRVSGNIDKILVFHFLGAAELAIYSFALIGPRQLQTFNGIIETLALPKTTQYSIQNIKKEITRKAFLVFLAAILVVGTYIIAAPFIFDLLFPQYIESVAFTQVLSLMVLFMPGILYRQVLVGHMKKKELYIIDTVVPTIKTLLFLGLLPLYGIWGAVYAILATKVISLAVMLFLFRKLK